MGKKLQFKYICRLNILDKLNTYNWKNVYFHILKEWSIISLCRENQFLEPNIPLVGEGNGTPLQYCWPEKPMDGGAWWAAAHGVSTSQTRLSDFTFTFNFHALEKEMATHSSVLAWRIPGTGEPGRLASMGSHRVGHDWSNLAAAAAFL